MVEVQRVPFGKRGVKRLERVLKKMYGLAEFELIAHDPRGTARHLFLSMMAVPSGVQGHGIGTLVMLQLCAYADTFRVEIVTVPTKTDWGTTSLARLERFYRKFGFLKSGAGRSYRPGYPGGSMWRPWVPPKSMTQVDATLTAISVRLAKAYDHERFLSGGVVKRRSAR